MEGTKGGKEGEGKDGRKQRKWAGRIVELNRSEQAGVAEAMPYPALPAREGEEGRKGGKKGREGRKEGIGTTDCTTPWF